MGGFRYWLLGASGWRLAAGCWLLVLLAWMQVVEQCLEHITGDAKAERIADACMDASSRAMSGTYCRAIIE